MTQEGFSEFARKKGWYDTILYQDISFEVQEGVSLKGFLQVIRSCFPDNYVGKEGRKYTIYCGDKDIQEMLNKEIKGLNPDPHKEVMKELSKLKEFSK